MSAPPGWPWPADTVLEQCRRVAQIYRHALATAAPQECADLDRHMTEVGQRWVLPTPEIHDPSDLLTADLAVDAMHVKRRTIYAWRQRGLPVVLTPDGPRYRLDDLRQFQTDQRRRRAGSRAG